MTRSTDTTNRSFHRIQLKYIDPTHKTDKRAIFETAFRDLLAPLTKLTETKQGFYATTDDQPTIDKLTSARAIELFGKINLKPIEPPELRSKKTVFVRQVDSTVGERPVDDIKTELMTNHSWLKVTEIVKIKNYTHVFKIVCAETQMATKIIESGINLFNTRIPPFNCSVEEFTHLQICYTCYKIEDHPTNRCTSTTKICSECSAIGHTWTECTSITKKCLNCPSTHNDHRTLAAKCPYRKKKAEEKKTAKATEENRKQNATFSQIVKDTIKQTAPPAQNIVLNNETQLKLTALILEAHIASLTGQGRFGDLLSESLHLNYKIDAKFPDRDSQRVFNLYWSPHQPDAPTTRGPQTTPRRIPEDRQDYTPLRNKYADLSDDKETDLGTEAEEADLELTKTPYETVVRRKKLRKRQTLNASGDLNSTIESMEHSPKTNKRKADDLPTEMPPPKQTTVVKIILYRSKEDPEPLPKSITDGYVRSQLAKSDEFGLKLVVAAGDPVIALRSLREAKVTLDNHPINYLDHEDFVKLPRVPPTPRYRHQSK